MNCKLFAAYDEIKLEEKLSVPAVEQPLIFTPHLFWKERLINECFPRREVAFHSFYHPFSYCAGYTTLDKSSHEGMEVEATFVSADRETHSHLFSILRISKPNGQQIVCRSQRILSVTGIY